MGEGVLVASMEKDMQNLFGPLPAALFFRGGTFFALSSFLMLWRLSSAPPILEATATALAMTLSIAFCIAGYLVLPQHNSSGQPTAARVKSWVVQLDFWYVVVGCAAAAFTIATTTQSVQAEWDASQKHRIELSESHERSRVNGRFFHASRFCDQAHGMSDPLCSKLAEAFVETLDVRGRALLGPQTRAVCEQAKNYPTTMEASIDSIREACRAIKSAADRAIDVDEGISSANVLMKSLDFGLKLTVCVAIGIRLAKAIADRFWLPRLDGRNVNQGR